MPIEGKSSEQIADLAALAESLANNPKTRQQFLHLTKLANPEAAIPEVDIPAQLNGMLQKGLERIQKVEEENRAMKTEREIMAKRDALLGNKKFGLTKDDLPEVEKLMLEKHIPDHETAAEFYTLQKQSAVPTPANAKQIVQGATMPSMDLKPFNGNLNDWARNAARQAMDDMRSGQIKI